MGTMRSFAILGTQNNDGKTAKKTGSQYSIAWSTYPNNIGMEPKDFLVVVEVGHVGARFEALDKLVFMVRSYFIGIFYFKRIVSGAICIKDLPPVIKVNPVFLSPGLFKRL